MTSARTMPLKAVADVLVSHVDKKTVAGETPVRLCNYVDVYYNGRITDELPFLEASAKASDIATFALQPGDVLITKDSETPADIAKAAYVPGPLSRVVCGYHLALLRPRLGAVVDGRYLYWTMCSQPVVDYFSSAAQGVTRFGLRASAIASAPVPLPDLETQRAIADYLDREVGRIEAVQRLLQQLSMSLVRWMSASVDGAFESTASPEWRLRRVLTRLEQGWSPAAEDRQALVGEWAVLKTSSVGQLGFNDAEHKALSRETAPRRELEVRPGDLLVVRGSGSRDLVARAALVDSVRPHLMICDLLYRLRVRDDLINSHYLLWFLRSRMARGQIEASVTGTVGDAIKVRGSVLRELLLPLPALDDQQRIARGLGERSVLAQRIDDALSAAHRLLDERRSALITAASSGQINVIGREAA